MWATLHAGRTASWSAVASAPRKLGILPTTRPGGLAAPSCSRSARIRSRMCCLARSIALGSCAGWAVNWSHLRVAGHQGEEPFMHVLHNWLVAQDPPVTPGCGAVGAG